MNLADTHGGNRLGAIHFLDAQTGFVFVEVLALEAGALVVWPDEGLAAVDVIQTVGVWDFIADEAEVGADGELMKGDFVADAPVCDRETIVGAPEHRFADTVIESAHAVFALDDRGVGAPGDA